MLTHRGAHEVFTPDVYGTAIMDGRLRDKETPMAGANWSRMITNDNSKQYLEVHQTAMTFL